MGRPPITDWDAQPLGQAPDAEIAAELGCSPETVRRHRERRKITMHGRVDWRTVTDLGVSSDVAIARRLGVHFTTVLKARRRAGLPAVRHLGHRGIDWDAVPDLGISTDDAIAQRLGVHRSAVQSARNRRGIPRAPRREVDWDATGDLGTTWDEALAVKHGVIAGSVSAARKRRGIPRYTEQRRCACGREFTATTSYHAYCSENCRFAGADARLRLQAPDGIVPVHVALCALRREVLARTGKGRRNR